MLITTFASIMPLWPRLWQCSLHPYWNGQAMSGSSAQSGKIVISRLAHGEGGWTCIGSLPFSSTRGNSAANLIDLSAGFINLHWFASLSFFYGKEENSAMNFRIQLPPFSFVTRKWVFLTRCPQGIIFFLGVIHYGYWRTCQNMMSYFTQYWIEYFLPSSYLILLIFARQQLFNHPPFPSLFLLFFQNNKPTNVRLLSSY